MLCSSLPKVSVIVPVYNTLDYLPDCVFSLLEQTYDNIEVICVDDGSTDGSLAWLTDLSKRDNRLNVLSLSHVGPGRARNEGMRVSTGDYVFFMDSDDLLRLDAINVLVKRALKTNADIVFCQLADFKTKVKEALLSQGYGLTRWQIPEREFFTPSEIRDFVFTFSYGGPVCKLIKKTLLVEHDLTFPPLEKSEDFPFVGVAIALSQKLSVVYDSLYMRRLRDDSLENSKEDKPVAFYDAILYFEKKLKDLAIFSQYEQSFINANLARFSYNISTTKSVVARNAIIHKLRDYSSTLKLETESLEYFFNLKALNVVCSALGISVPASKIYAAGYEDSAVKLSIVIPFYNCEKYFTECLNSVRNCSLKDIEVICVDNNSTDGSRAIAESFANEDSRFTVVGNDVGFAGESRNKGLTLARGKYVHFLDADDKVDSKAYSILCDLMERHSLDFIEFRAQAFDSESGDYVENKVYSLNNISVENFGKLMSFPKNRDLFQKMCDAPWSKICNREFLLLNKIKFSDLICCNDNSFHVAVYTRCHRAMFADLLGLYYRVNMKNSLIGVRAKNFDCLFSNLEIVKSLCSEIPVQERSKILNQTASSIDHWYGKYENDNVFILRYALLGELKNKQVVYQDRFVNKQETKARIRRVKRQLWVAVAVTNLISVALTSFLLM